MNATAREETYLSTAMAAPSLMVMFIIMYSLWQPPRGAYKCGEPFLHGTTLVSVTLKPLVRSMWTPLPCPHRSPAALLFLMEDFSFHWKA
jgi:hypothetical protein